MALVSNLNIFFGGQRYFRHSAFSRYSELYTKGIRHAPRCIPIIFTVAVAGSPAITLGLLGAGRLRLTVKSSESSPILSAIRVRFRQRLSLAGGVKLTEKDPPT